MQIKTYFAPAVKAGGKTFFDNFLIVRFLGFSIGCASQFFRYSWIFCLLRAYAEFTISKPGALCAPAGSGAVNLRGIKKTAPRAAGRPDGIC